MRTAVRWTAFAVGILPPALKLFASFGIPWTQLWVGMYLFSFVITAAIKRLAEWDRAAVESTDDQINADKPDPSSERERYDDPESAVVEVIRPHEEAPNENQIPNALEHPSTTPTPAESKAKSVEKPSTGNFLDDCLEWCDWILGCVAVLSEIAILGWVDLKVMPPKYDPKKWAFVTLRTCGHVLAAIMNLAIVSFLADRPVLTQSQKNIALTASMSAIFITLAILHSFNLRFSLMYFMLSIVLSWLAWLLLAIPFTRQHILFCSDKEKRNWWKNVLAFDFFTRVLFFSTYWYVWHYDSTNTSMQWWTSGLG